MYVTQNHGLLMKTIQKIVFGMESLPLAPLRDYQSAPVASAIIMAN